MEKLFVWCVSFLVLGLMACSQTPNHGPVGHQHGAMVGDINRKIAYATPEAEKYKRRFQALEDLHRGVRQVDTPKEIADLLLGDVPPNLGDAPQIRVFRGRCYYLKEEKEDDFQEGRFPLAAEGGDITIEVGRRAKDLGPGLGGVKVESYIKLYDLTRDLNTFREYEPLPFKPKYAVHPQYAFGVGEGFITVVTPPYVFRTIYRDGFFTDDDYKVEAKTACSFW